ncbi:hypothetical protein C8A03DRAFT_14252 [Achaetomium macrosporum]|uniref:Uncharacterized protein n=1 Tax=Achaetomium macrosporum TaxID=79813 RepID=A0AAN7CC52_9PEZI|nr:hypothetical protein C8A03DRAFT_14252 [Achaetomium macrosporum]
MEALRKIFPALSEAGGVAGHAPVVCLFALASAILGVTWRLTRRAPAPQIAHEQALKMATESMASLFPNRPIRPLPKRRLRERLSPEVADSIQYPPLPQSTAPVFQYPYSLIEEHSDPGSVPAREAGPCPEQRPSQGNGTGNEHERDKLTNGNGAASRTGLQHPNLVTRPKPEHGRYSDSLPLSSTPASADPYDPFENTNNKKRKIPTAGDSALSGAHTGSESAAGTSPPATETRCDRCTTQLLVGPVPGGPAGRARVSGPMEQVSQEVVREIQLLTGCKGESTGIISNAIANAEKLPPHQGQENISLLQQQSAPKRSAASTQFTFTCDSQVPGSVAWPGSDRRVVMPPHQPAAVGQSREDWPRPSQATHAGQPSQETSQGVDRGAREAASRAGVGGQNPQPAPPQKSTRRSATKEYLAAARARRRQTQLNNKRHPPKPEDIWICHFCEYEAIFGHPPEALVRQYEIKERKQRQLEEQRKAHLQRLKKGKNKGKKSSKLPKTNNTAQDTLHPAYNHGAAGDHYDHGSQGEGYYDDDEYYDDEEYVLEEEAAAEDRDEIPELLPDVPANPGTTEVRDGGGT